MGVIANTVQERRLTWYGHMTTREEYYIGRRSMEMKVRWRRKRGIPNRRWSDKVMEGTSGGACVRPCYFEPYVIVHRPHRKMGIR